MIIGPLTILKFKGLLCPCLEKEEDAMVRPAASSLSHVLVHWYRPTGEDSGVMGSAMNLMSNWIGKGSEESEKPKKKSGRSDVGVHAFLSFEDSIRGPCLVIRMKDSNEDDNDEAKEEEDQQRCTTRRWPLKKLEKATAVEAGYFMGGRATAASSGIVLHKRIKSGSTVECCKIDLCSQGNSSFETLADTSERDNIIDKMNLVITWNRQRHDTQEEDDDDESDDEVSGKSNMITDRAKKAAHFAKREIEMKKQKREREQKKSRYLKETGGLKYTAVAMANRAGVS